MNRTLLLILCDFLLLNLLALTRWEQAEPPPVSKPPVASATTGSAGTTPGQDLVETMKLSLVDERQRGRELLERFPRKAHLTVGDAQVELRIVYQRVVLGL